MADVHKHTLRPVNEAQTLLWFLGFLDLYYENWTDTLQSGGLCRHSCPAPSLFSRSVCYENLQTVDSNSGLSLFCRWRRGQEKIVFHSMKGMLFFLLVTICRNSKVNCWGWWGGVGALRGSRLSQMKRCEPSMLACSKSHRQHVNQHYWSTILMPLSHVWCSCAQKHRTKVALWCVGLWIAEWKNKSPHRVNAVKHLMWTRNRTNTL